MKRSPFKGRTITLENGHQVVQPFNKAWIITPLVLIALWISVEVTEFSLITLIERGKNFFNILAMMFPPNMAYVDNVIQPMIATLSMSFVGTLLAAILALPMGYLTAANMNRNKWSLWFFRLIMSVLRTLPVLVLALLLTYVFGYGTFAGTAALFLFTVSIITKMFYEQIETVDMGPYEALESSGASRVRCFAGAVMPQVMGQYISTVLYNFEMNVRSAAILGYVGAGGIGLLMDEKIGWREYDKLATILIILLITVLLVEWTSRAIRRRIIG